MGSEKIGKVKGGSSGKQFDVRWDPSSKEVYIDGDWGRAFVDKASSASEAMRKAEAWAYQK